MQSPFPVPLPQQMGCKLQGGKTCKLLLLTIVTMPTSVKFGDFLWTYHLKLSNLPHFKSLFPAFAHCPLSKDKKKQKKKQLNTVEGRPEASK